MEGFRQAQRGSGGGEKPRERGQKRDRLAELGLVRRTSGGVKTGKNHAPSPKEWVRSRRVGRPRKSAIIPNPFHRPATPPGVVVMARPGGHQALNSDRPIPECLLTSGACALARAGRVPLDISRSRYARGRGGSRRAPRSPREEPSDPPPPLGMTGLRITAAPPRRGVRRGRAGGRSGMSALVPAPSGRAPPGSAPPRPGRAPRPASRGAVRTA